MSIGNRIRGGAGSNHYSGRMDYPYEGDGSPSTPKPSSMRYSVHEGGGDYLQVTATGDDKHTVSRYGGDNKLKGSVEGAYFGHDTKTGMASWQSSSDPKGYFGTGNVKVTDGYSTEKD